MKKSKAVSRYLILFALCMLAMKSIFAQNNQHQTYLQQQMGITVNHHSLDDSLITPGTITGNAIKFSYGISETGLKRKTTLKAAYENGFYKNGTDKIKENAFALSLSDGFNVLARASSKAGIYIGYELSTYSSYTWNTANTDINNRYSWNSYNTIAFYQSYTYSWNKQSLILDISIPVVGITYRPQVASASSSSISETKTLNHVLATLYSNPSFSSLHNNLKADISLSYRQRISERINLSAHYNFTYWKWTGETKLISQSNGWGISVGYSFSKHKR